MCSLVTVTLAVVGWTGVPSCTAESRVCDKSSLGANEPQPE